MLACSRQQGMCEGDRPAAVLAVDHRASARSDDAEERAELVGERLGVGDGQLDFRTREGRCVPTDEPWVRRIRGVREREPLGEVVELEHALLTDDRELAALRRRKTV